MSSQDRARKNHFEDPQNGENQSWEKPRAVKHSRTPKVSPLVTSPHEGR